MVQAALQGGIVVNGSVVYMGGKHKRPAITAPHHLKAHTNIMVIESDNDFVYMIKLPGTVDNNIGVPTLQATYSLPPAVRQVSGLQGPPPLSVPTRGADGQAMVAFCSEMGSFGGGVVRLLPQVQQGPPAAVSFVNESASVYYQGCIGDDKTGIVYLLDGGEDLVEGGMNVRSVASSENELSPPLPLPLHALLPTGNSLHPKTALASSAGLLFVAAAYEGILPDGSITWSWGVSVVHLATFSLLQTFPVADLATTAPSTALGSMFAGTVAASHMFLQYLAFLTLQ